MENEQKTERARRIHRSYMARIRFRDELTLPGIKRQSWNIVTVRNISSSGILFNFDQSIPLGTIIEFKITMPFVEFECTGEICRLDQEKVNPMTEQHRVIIRGAAARFIDVDEETKKMIDEFAEHFGK